MAIKAGHKRLRSVRLPSHLATKLEQLENEFPRVKEVYKGLRWRLEHEPRIGIPAVMSLDESRGASDGSIRVVRSSGEFDLPILSVTFQFDADYVEILGLRAFPPGKYSVLL